METTTIAVAGATGDLGYRITKALIARGAKVRAIVREDTSKEKVQRLQKVGVEVVEVDLNDVLQVAKAVSGASCVVSALAGLKDVIVDTQLAILQGAIKADVPRFIPSDFSIDFTNLPPGSNRNFDLRREFHQHLNRASIAPTSIFNGAFTEILVGTAPIILSKWKRILYWQDADLLMNFTAIDDTAAYTAAVALDSSAPRTLHIAGDQISARELAVIMSEVSGKKFSLLRAGSLSMLERLIKVTRVFVPGKSTIYPAWQGMQYLHNMFSGLAHPSHLDNERYPGAVWTSVRDMLFTIEAVNHDK